MAIADESTYTAQVKHGHDAYRTGATGLPVQTDQDAREDLDDSAHAVVTNAELATALTTTVGPLGNDVYTGGNIIDVTGQVSHAVKVFDAVQEGLIFDRGGFIDVYDAASNYSSPYVDGVWLAEASKQTGEKFF